MTQTLTRPRTIRNATTGAVEQSRTIDRVALFAALAVIFVISVSLRWFRAHEAWDIYVDEITYLRLAQNAISTGRIELYGEPFYLHPPLVFFLQGAFLWITGASGSLVSFVYATRDYNVLVGGLTACVLFLLGRSYGGFWLGGALALAFAIDPFANRLNVRTLLEPTAMLAIVSGYTLLAQHLLKNPGKDLAAWRIFLVGTMFGLGMLCKEMALFCCVAPIALGAIRGMVLPVRSAVGIVLVALDVYAIYPIAVFIGGDGGNFLEHKLRGFYRLAGIVKETGFKHGGPSFVDALIANLDRLGTTYLLLALSVPAIIYLWTRRTAAMRLLVLWTFCTYGLIGYALGFGTIEEQFFYFLFIPSLVVVVVAASLIVRAGTNPAPIRWGIGLAGIAFVVWSSVVWARIHFVDDNGFERLIAYVEHNVPTNAPIAVTNETAVFVFEDHPIGSWGTVETMIANRAQYAVFSVKEVYKGYGYARPEAYEWAQANGDLVFSFAGPTNERLELYRLP